MGYIEGIYYFIEFIRKESDMPILIWDDHTTIDAVRRVINKYNYVYQYVDDPKNTSSLKNLNIAGCHHVIIISKKMEENELLDFDAILLANYIQEWYPQVKFTVEFKNENSIKMMESTIFENENTELDKIYTKSYMSGKVFNSDMFLNIGSKLKSNPFQLQFLNDILYTNSKKPGLMTLLIDKKLGKFLKIIPSWEDIPVDL